ncbi:hypothetical protein, partial [Salinispora fenicalii]|uniref:hypothetical protein n=1 Tax=Salinispora fenicalii TaxID=1137263 RepID=UPI00053551A8
PITLNGGKHTTIERAAAVDEFRILTVNTGGNLTLNKLKLTGGQTDGDGGAILVNPGGALTTHHSTITRNIAESDGGGIASNGTAHLRHSTVERNTAAGVGGGITSVGALDIKKTRVYANTALDGAGINSEGTVRIERSAITANHAEDTTGGLLVEEGIATVTDTEVSHNSGVEVGGILANFDAQVTLRSVALVDNAARTARAGGLAMNPGATIVIEDSLVKNNTAVTDGGGLYNLVEMVLRRTKVVGNQAGNEGAGIYNEATGILTVVDSKIVRNTAAVDGGGIFNDAGGTVNLETATGTVVTENRPNNCVNVPGCAG